MSHKQSIRRTQRRSGSSKLGSWWLIIGVGILGVFGAWWLLADQAPAEPQAPQTTRVSFPHIHGMGWTGDGSQLIVAAHDGYRIWSQNRWNIPDAPKHDFMGYAPTDSGFYSSGHPDPTISSLINPLGLVMSDDGGRTLTTLGFAGEHDFHTMGVGYYSHAIYVFNPNPTPTLAGGINYSLDNGKTWHPSPLPELASEPYQIAVHPTDPAVVVIATETGALLSNDFGTTAIPLGTPEPITALAFSPAGNSLFLGSTSLTKYDYTTKDMLTLATPLRGGDMISAIAINPVQPREIVIATHNRNLYRSGDAGQTWMPIAVNGVGIEQP